MKRKALVLGGLLGWLASGSSCETGDATSPAGPATTALVAAEQTTAAGADAPVAWTIDHRPVHFLVTPRWSPDGNRLLVSGYGGRGLFVVDTAMPSTLRAIDGAVRGPAWWSPDGRDVLTAVPSTSDAFVACDAATGTRRFVERPAFLPRATWLADGRAGAVVLHEGADGEVLFEEYRGRLVARNAGSERVLAEADAWGPRASSDGRRVAWSVGHLVGARLCVSAIDGVAQCPVVGAHPAWLADGERLVFDRPQTDPGGDGHHVDRSDLYLLDVETGLAERLTDTPEDAEMEPAVSPDGVRLAWSDWRTGTIGIVRIDTLLPAREGGAP